MWLWGPEVACEFVGFEVGFVVEWWSLAKACDTQSSVEVETIVVAVDDERVDDVRAVAEGQPMFVVFGIEVGYVVVVGAVVVVVDGGNQLGSRNDRSTFGAVD